MATERVKIGEREVEIRPLDLLQMRNHWKDLGGRGTEYDEMLSMSALWVGLSIGEKPDDVLRGLLAGEPGDLFAAAIRVQTISGILKKGPPAGEPASP